MRLAPLSLQLQGYPLGPGGYVRQCAWCWLVADAEGCFSLVAPHLRDASHGICPACKAAQVRELVEAPQAAESA